MPCGTLAPSQPLRPGEVRERASFLAQSHDLGRLWLWNSHLAYTPERRFAVVCDLVTGTATVVGRQETGKGAVDWIRGDRETVVWMDYDSPPDSSGPTGSPWTMHTVQLDTSKTTVVATGRPAGGHFTLPSPEIEWPYIVWTDLPKAGDITALGPELVIYDLRDGTRRVLSSKNFPGDPSITNGLVYFDAATAQSGTRDLYVVPADGSAQPHKLTDEKADVVIEVRARGGWVTWLRTPKNPQGAIGELPIMALRAGTTKPIQVATGRPAEPGANGVVYNSESSLHVVHPTGEGRPRVVVGHVVDLGSRWSVDGDLVAYAAADDPGGKPVPAHVHIVQVG